jgi:hypothetical protein
MAVSITAKLMAWKMRFESHKAKEIILFYTKFRMALGSIQPPTQWATELFLEK